MLYPQPLIEIGKDTSAHSLHLPFLYFQPHLLPGYRYLKRSDDRLLIVSIFEIKLLRFLAPLHSCVYPDGHLDAWARVE